MVKGNEGTKRIIIKSVKAVVMVLILAAVLCAVDISMDYIIKVDVGNGVKISQHEYRKFEKAYEKDIKDTAYEMVTVERALKDLGIELTEDEIKAGLEDYKSQAWLYGADYDEDKARIDTKVMLLSDKAVEYFKQFSVVTDDDINNAVNEQHELSQVAGEYKKVSSDDAQKIVSGDISFENIDGSATVIEGGTTNGMDIDEPKSAVVGDVSTYTDDDGNVTFVKVSSIINDNEDIRSKMKDFLKEEKAKDQFTEFLEQTMGRSIE